jgi:hypothetical protein
MNTDVFFFQSRIDGLIDVGSPSGPPAAPWSLCDVLLPLSLRRPSLPWGKLEWDPIPLVLGDEIVECHVLSCCFLAYPARAEQPDDVGCKDANLEKAAEYASRQRPRGILNAMVMSPTRLCKGLRLKRQTCFVPRAP